MATTARPGKEETRARIVTAALQALRADGIAGISARAIARHGGFNQALIFYHFGSLEGLLVAVGSDELARGVWAALEPWTTLVQGTVERLLADTPYRDALPLDDLTFAITALFLGVELLTGLDPNGRQTTLFATMESAAALVDGLVRGSPAATTTEGVSPPAAR